MDVLLPSTIFSAPELCWQQGELSGRSHSAEVFQLKFTQIIQSEEDSQQGNSQ